MYDTSNYSSDQATVIDYLIGKAYGSPLSSILAVYADGEPDSAATFNKRLSEAGGLISYLKDALTDEANRAGSSETTLTSRITSTQKAVTATTTNSLIQEYAGTLSGTVLNLTGGESVVGGIWCDLSTVTYALSFTSGTVQKLVSHSNQSLTVEASSFIDTGTAIIVGNWDGSVYTPRATFQTTLIGASYSGDVQVGGNLGVTGNTTITGNLTVLGTNSVSNSTTVTFQDTVLNLGIPAVRGVNLSAPTIPLGIAAFQGTTTTNTKGTNNTSTTITGLAQDGSNEVTTGSYNLVATAGTTVGTMKLVYNGGLAVDNIVASAIGVQIHGGLGGILTLTVGTIPVSFPQTDVVAISNTYNNYQALVYDQSTLKWRMVTLNTDNHTIISDSGFEVSSITVANTLGASQIGFGISGNLGYLTGTTAGARLDYGSHFDGTNWIADQTAINSILVGSSGNFSFLTASGLTPGAIITTATIKATIDTTGKANFNALKLDTLAADPSSKVLGDLWVTATGLRAASAIDGSAQSILLADSTLNSAKLLGALPALNGSALTGITATQVGALPIVGGTLTGKTNFLAATLTGAGINLGIGVTPSSGQVNGDLWLTASTPLLRLGGVNRTILLDTGDGSGLTGITATQVGAVPIAGGTATGAVIVPRLGFYDLANTAAGNIGDIQLVAGILYITNNCVWDGTNWNRTDITKAYSAEALDNGGNRLFFNGPSGVNPIGTTLQSRDLLTEYFSPNWGAIVGLTYAYNKGVVIQDNVVTQVPGNTIGLTASATNYLEINPATGVLYVNTSGFNIGHFPIAAITTNTTNIVPGGIVTARSSFVKFTSLPGDLRCLAGTGLALNYAAGMVNLAGIPTSIAGSSITLTDAVTNYVYVSSTGVVSLNTTGWVTNTTAIPLAQVVCAGGVISNVLDKRAFLSLGGGGSSGRTVTDITATVSGYSYTVPGTNTYLIFRGGKATVGGRDWIQSGTTITFQAGYYPASGEEVLACS